MRKQTDSDRLLNDVLEESVPPDFQSELLSQTLRQVRRRRRIRQCGQAVFALALVVAIPLLLWQRPLPPVEIAQSQPLAFRVIQSQPLAPSMIVESVAGSVNFVESSPSTVAVIESAAGRNLFSEVDDAELLTLLKDYPAVLVRQGPHQAELVFVNADDQEF